jgi:hypothetical protein
MHNKLLAMFIGVTWIAGIESGSAKIAGSTQPPSRPRM